MNEYCSAGHLLKLTEPADTASAYIAVVGCGGKTTFIESLADELRDRKVLIAPTAKILPFYSENVILRTTLSQCLAHEPAHGIQCLGVLNEATGKLEAIPPEHLEGIVRQYDIALFEADGSRSLPCKGWLPGEPVVPHFATHTVGIVTFGALGKTADENTVHRLPEFLALTGLHRGDIINERALTDMVCAEDGMFRHNSGSLSIFVNQAEDAEVAKIARKWLSEIRARSPGRFDCLAYGSARQNKWTEV